MLRERDVLRVHGAGGRRYDKVYNGIAYRTSNNHSLYMSTENSLSLLCPYARGVISILQ